MTTRTMLALVREPLTALGLRKRSGAIFTMELAPDVIGWLGLNTASKYLPTGVVEVNPVVGVRHQTVERLIADLRGEAFHAYLPPTVSISIGYVMPERCYVGWDVGEGRPEAVAELTAAVERHGLPYMRRLVELPALCEAVEQRQSLRPEYQLPPIRLLLGRRNQALEGLAEDVKRLGDRQDAAALELRSFAEAFARHVDATS
ncbi:MAG TPA: hypothetical protein VNO33_23775 [Kofleriaceae bacterium]|nr:hypothetical protein [Kofleriaceae bacterium]